MPAEAAPISASFSRGPVAETTAMVRFYSRLSVPPLGRLDDPATPPPFPSACRMLPVAALIIGLPSAAAAALLALSALPPLAGAAIATAIALATTGALHEDGLADVADGFGGGRTRERKLEIMKDSRLGAYGAIALVLALMVKAALVAHLMAQSPLAVGLGLLAAAIASRVASLCVFAALPPARPDGVAGRIGRPEPAAAKTAVAMGLALVVLLGAWGGWPGIAQAGSGLVVAGLSVWWIGRMALRQIGGQTGDVIGAAQVIAELGYLIGLALW